MKKVAVITDSNSGITQSEAKKLGNPKVFNTIIIGVAAKHMDFDHDKWVEVIKATVPPKTVEMNLKAFEVGYAL